MSVSGVADSSKMLAAICERYGGPDVLRVGGIEKPVPRDHEVLVRVRATTVTSADSRIRAMRVPLGFGWPARVALGFGKPRRPVLGVECAGVVEAVGAKVRELKVGDRVFGMDSVSMGCHAEFKCFAEQGALALKPDCLTHEEAAALPFGGTTALYFLERASLKRGDRLLINGAAGAVGTAMLQLAKHMGAHVTAVCSSGNSDLVRALGADLVIDYARNNFMTDTECYDLIADLVGNAPYPKSRHVLTSRGRLLMLVPGIPDLWSVLWCRLTSDHRVIAGTTAEKKGHLLRLCQLVEAGSYRPVIGRGLLFDQIALAHCCVDAGHKRGSITLKMAIES